MELPDRNVTAFLVFVGLQLIVSKALIFIPLEEDFS